MFRFTPYILKTLWRHRLRTVLTMSGAAVALFVYAMVGSVSQALEELSSKGENTVIVFQANKFCPATSHLYEDYERKIAKISGVREVLPIKVFTNNCRASLDVVVFYGVPVERLKRFRDFRMLAGNWNEFGKDQDMALVGQVVADRRGLEVGDQFSIGDISVTVAGIFSSDDKAEENYVYTHLKFLQRKGGENQEGKVTQLEVLLDDSADSEAVCTAIDDLFRGGPVATDTRSKGAFQMASLADLFELIDLAQILGYACVGLMVVLVTTTSFMSIQDRIREHAILQTIGFSPWRVFLIVLSESLILSAVGGMVGAGAALGYLSWFPLSIGAEAVALTVTPSLTVVAMAAALALAIGIIAGIFPAIQAARAEIVPALRHAA